MYRAARIEGRDGFVTFRRKPANWHAKEEESKEAAEAAAPSSSRAATMVFLASLFVAVAGTIIGEHAAPRPLHAVRWDGCLCARHAHASLARRSMHTPICPLLQHWAAWGLCSTTATPAR